MPAGSIDSPSQCLSGLHQLFTEKDRHPHKSLSFLVSFGHPLLFLPPRVEPEGKRKAGDDPDERLRRGQPRTDASQSLPPHR